MLFGVCSVFLFMTSVNRNGNSDSVIMVGAHLDGVEAGAGINDNGSGSALVLELAIAAARSFGGAPNRMRFCWWGAEEEGLLGSTAYVRTRTAEQLKAIKVERINIEESHFMIVLLLLFFFKKNKLFV
jgi:Zn-dependent M28 family amino/carboxypeptidase